MKIVIDIPDEVKEVFDNANIADVDCYVNDYDLLLGKAIKNGTPLPKGHGRLIDADALDKSLEKEQEVSNLDNELSNIIDAFNDGLIWASEVLSHADTIIEADKC